MSLSKSVLVAVLVLGAACAPERELDRTLVIPVGQLGASPVPTLTSHTTANNDLMVQMFLRLADLPPSGTTSGDDGFVPLLADSWERRDPVTLAFHLDPSARWHDGVPVTAHDVVFTFGRAQDPRIDPSTTTLLAPIIEVVEEDASTVVFRFSRPFTEQFYTAIYHVFPLPAHLLEGLDPDSISTSAYMSAPVGNGPYVFEERVSGQRVSFRANQDFFLGRPDIDRVVFQAASDPDARLNLLLSGEADIASSVSPLDVRRIEANPSLRVFAIPTYRVGYMLFNQLDPADLDRPHPILSDRRVRQAITYALDRETMLEAVFRGYATLPHAPVARLQWINDATDTGIPFDPERASALLDEAGWTMGPGGRVKDGRPLVLRLNYPSTSRTRVQYAQLIQEQLRQVGIDLRLEGVEGSVWVQRRNASSFDMDMARAGMDPSPAGIAQSWSCAGIGGSNVGHYCNFMVDTLVAAAIYAPTNALPLWRQLVDTVQADAPAVFLYAPDVIFGIDRRFGNVTLPPYSYWSGIWQWTVSAKSSAPDVATTP